MATLKERINRFLEEEMNAHPTLSASYQKFGELHDRKLWHQLTVAVLAFVKDPQSCKADNLVRLHDDFVTHFSGKIDQLEYAKMVVVVARSACKHYAADGAEAFNKAIAFVNGISGGGVDVSAPASDTSADATATEGAGESKAEEASGDVEMVDAEEVERKKARELAMSKRRRIGQDAFVVCEAEVALLRLAQARWYQAQGQAEPAREAFAACEALGRDCARAVEGLDMADPFVHAQAYRALSEYHKAQGPAESYYKYALRFLAYTPVEDMALAERVAYATDLSLAALVGEGIYNFGEVIALPILASLKESKLGWLESLLQAFNSGDIEGFNSIMADNASEISKQPALSANAARLKEKIALLCLMETIFHRPAENRNITFTDIAAATRLPVDQVELLLMRAMSLGLVKGEIDQVVGSVNISWLQPRILDATQMASLKARLDAWCGTVTQAATFVESNTMELLSA